jgi:hypothetical protein
LNLKLSLVLISVPIAFLFVSCEPFRDNYVSVPSEVEGFRPIYFDSSQNITSMVYSTHPTPVKVAGKIYLFKHFLFVGEPSKGVHVFDNSNPANPAPVAFINIPFNYDIAVKDSVMYADTYMGLVVINIAAMPDIKVIKFIKSLSNSSVGFPPLPPSNAGGSVFGRNNPAITYFECIDFNKGVVVGWESVTLKKPKCYQ